ncbi:hypothetical protein ACFL1B_05420 [Nanoarchaeota archaeon]
MSKREERQRAYEKAFKWAKKYRPGKLPFNSWDEICKYYPDYHTEHKPFWFWLKVFQYMDAGELADNPCPITTKATKICDCHTCMITRKKGLENEPGFIEWLKLHRPEDFNEWLGFPKDPNTAYYNLYYVFERHVKQQEVLRDEGFY